MVNHFIIHKHCTTRQKGKCHIEIRLEDQGVLKSWVLPKGIPQKTHVRPNLAIRTEDHPLSYLSFKGTIPQGQYGAGEVFIKDYGTFDKLEWTEEKKEVQLHGRIVKGKYLLLTTKKYNLIKKL